jgi:hypothetical protein
MDTKGIYKYDRLPPLIAMRIKTHFLLEWVCNNNEITQIIKENDLFNKIKSCFWFEEILKINRYQINDIKCDDISNMKTILNKNIEKLYFIFKNNDCKNKTIKALKNRIESIITLNLLQKFFADCYNYIIKDIIKISKKNNYVKKQYVNCIYIFK